MITFRKMKTSVKFFAAFLIFCSQFVSHAALSQDEIDVVDPYEMKVSRSRQADTFYFSQNATTSAIKKKLDTLRTYDVYLEERPTPFGKAYMCNGNEVTRQKYLEYKRFWDAAGACKPCLLYTYNDKDQLKYVAFQYEDCLCGSYVEYYPDGGMKVQGQFKQNTNDVWQNIKSMDVCNIRDGLWTYYTETGEVLRVETYVDGKIIDKSNASYGTSVGTRSKKESVEKDSDAKKSLFPKMKDKNKQSQ